MVVSVLRLSMLAAVLALVVQPAPAAPLRAALASGYAPQLLPSPAGTKCGKKYLRCVTIAIGRRAYEEVKYYCSGGCKGVVFWSASAYERTASGYVQTDKISAETDNGSYGPIAYVTITTSAVLHSHHNRFLADVIGCNFYTYPNCQESKIGVTVTPS